jgi:hypothetical protein
MKVEVLSSTIIVSLIICGEKFLIFYNKSEEGKKYKEKGVEEFQGWWTIFYMSLYSYSLS